MSWLQKIEAELASFLTSTDVLRAASAEARAFAPIVTIGERVLVFKHADVVEVLGNDRAFGVTETYAVRMARTTGAFFLGMEDTPEYRRESTIARRAVRPDDAARIATIVQGEADALVERARAGGGRCDAVADYSRRIPLALLRSYFGTPGPDDDTMKRWMRAIFWDIFLNPDDDPAVRSAAADASAGLAPYLRGLIADGKRALAARDAARDDFVTRLLREQTADATIDDDLVRRNVGGIIVGAVDTLSKAIAQSLDQLLRHPRALEDARGAAAKGDLDAVSAYAFEALRFNPHNPAIFRTCHADTTIAEGTSRRTVIRAGNTIVAMTLSAMFDADVFDRPDEFRADRPAERYLHFGHGLHTCFGERINRIVVPLAIQSLLRLENLAYDADGPGEIEYEGPFPNSMRLAFDLPR